MIYLWKPKPWGTTTETEVDSFGVTITTTIDKNGNEISVEYSNGEWEKYEYDEQNREIFYNDDDNYWTRKNYVLNKEFITDSWGYASVTTKNENGDKIHFENNEGDWETWKYDENGNVIRYENNEGHVIISEYDEGGNQIYYEINGEVGIDERPDSNKKVRGDYVALT